MWAKIKSWALGVGSVFLIVLTAGLWIVWKRTKEERDAARERADDAEATVRALEASNKRSRDLQEGLNAAQAAWERAHAEGVAGREAAAAEREVAEKQIRDAGTGAGPSITELINREIAAGTLPGGEKKP
jgi:ABC-type nickel/cobalt efflux system permease component RcnA